MSYSTSNPAGTSPAGTDLALKVFSGEVLTAFASRNVFLPLVNTRTISSGKSAQFTVIGSYDAAIESHIPGTDIAINNIAGGEQTISIASRQYASVFVDEFEEAMSHYEVRGQYSTEIGNALATKVDKAVVDQLDACSSSTGVCTLTPYASVDGTVTAGTTYTVATTSAGCTALADGNGNTAGDITTAFAVDAITTKAGQPSQNDDIGLGTTFGVNEISGAIFEAVAGMESKNITGDKVCVLNPTAYYALVQEDKAVNRDFTNGNGGIDTGSVFNIAGVPIMMSNNVNSDSWGYVFTPAAVGVVKLMDIKSEANYIPEKLGTLMTSSYAMGEGILNAGCSVRLSKG